MAERGATPKVPKARQRALRAVRSLFSPLLPDDYLELINPLWSTRELRGRIERIEPETADAATVLIRPGYEWPGHRPGQYLRIGVVVDGVHHWRAYSLTSDPGRADGCIGDHPEAGRGRQGLALSGAAAPGPATSSASAASKAPSSLPDPLPREAALHQRRQRHHADHEHAPQPRPPRRRRRRRPRPLGADRRRRDLRRAPAPARRRPRRLRPAPAADRRAGPDRRRPTSTQLCPDWRERHTFASGPGRDARRPDRATGSGRAIRSCWRWSASSRSIGGAAGGGEGGAVRFAKSRVEAELRRRHADPRRRRGGRRHPALRLPDGDLPHLRRRAPLAARCGTCAPARSTAARERWSELASTPPRGRSRSHFETTERNPMTAATPRRPRRSRAR